MNIKGKILKKFEDDLQPLSYQSVSLASAFSLQSLSSSSSCFTSSISGGALHPRFIIPNSFFLCVRSCSFISYVSRITSHSISVLSVILLGAFCDIMFFWCFGGKLLYEIKNDVFLVFLCFGGKLLYEIKIFLISVVSVILLCGFSDGFT